MDRPRAALAVLTLAATSLTAPLAGATDAADTLERWAPAGGKSWHAPPRFGGGHKLPPDPWRDHWRDTKPDSLQRAGERLDRLDARHDRLERDLYRARRHGASRHQIRELQHRLRRVEQRQRWAREDYRELLERRLGKRQYQQLMRQVAWLGRP